MEILTTERIEIITRYDLMDRRTKGKIYSKIEGEEKVEVAYVIEQPKGENNLYLLAKYRDKDYIVEDYEKLKKEFNDIASMWRARESRGIC